MHVCCVCHFSSHIYPCKSLNNCLLVAMSGLKARLEVREELCQIAFFVTLVFGGLVVASVVKLSAIAVMQSNL